MLLENEPIFNSKSDGAEDCVITFFEKLGAGKPPKEEIINLLQSGNGIRYFKFNTDQYCTVLKLLLEDVDNSSEFMTILKDDNAFQKAILARDDFYISFFDILLPTLIETYNKFPEEDKVLDETSKVVGKCVLSNNLQVFENYLTEAFDEKKSSEKHSLCRILFKYISQLISNNDNPSCGCKLLFYSISKSFKKFPLTYRLLVLFVQILGFELKDEFGLSKVKYQISKPSLDNALNILNQLLDVISRSKFDLELKLKDTSFSDFLKNLLQSIMASNTAPRAATYEIFLKIIEINPLIIESLINETILYTMLNDNRHCKSEYEQLMIKIFEVFSKLHRIQNFISKMIPTLKSGIDKRELNEPVYAFRGSTDTEIHETTHNIDDIFPKPVLDCFTNCILNLASWQVINLFKTLLFHLNKAVEELPDQKSVYMEILSTLTCWILLSVRIAEHTVAPSTVVKFVGGLEELRAILGNFGRILLQREHNPVLMRSFLNICFYWADVYITLEYYSASGDLKMIKHLDSNFSACNLTYLHSYLSDKEWCLISERISNFGGRPCMDVMQRLMIQKLRAFLTFGESSEDILLPIVRDLSTNFNENSLEMFTDRFVINHVLPKMAEDDMICLAEVIVKDLVESRLEILNQPHVWDSELIKNAVLSVIFTKIGKLLKQKRKLNDASLKKSLFSKIVSVLPPDMFLCTNIDEYLGKLPEVISESDEQALDIKIHDKKIAQFLSILTKVPVIFCGENTQKLFILLLTGLMKDVKTSNSEESLAKTCESLIISVLQHSKFTLLDLFNADVVIKLLLGNFERYEDAFLHISQPAFKNDLFIARFQPGIAYIVDNIKDIRCLKLAVTVLNLATKVKKLKISADSKNLCSQYKSQICRKIIKLLGKKQPEDDFIEPYALVLKTFLTKDENDSLAVLKTRLSEYCEYCLRSISQANIKGCLLLFTTILHHKSVLSDFKEDLVLNIWAATKNVKITSEVEEMYSQLVMLVAALIPNEQFANIFRDLLKITGEAIDQGNEQDLSKHLQSWTCILRTNFNPVKTNVLREQLEFLLGKLIHVLRSSEHKEDLFEEVIQFEVSIIQANHIPLTAAIMDFFLLTVSIVMMKESHDFVHNFDCCISLLENLLKYRNPLIMDRLPPYLLQYRLLLKKLCTMSGSKLALEQNQVQKISDCAHKLEKLTKSLVECTKDMGRISMYLIADILGQYEQDTLYPNVKKHLDNCIYSLISLCDQHAVQYLMRVLSNASTEIFKFMYENYKKYYRFTGKV